MDKCKLVDDGNLSFAKHIVALMPEQFHTKDIIPHCIPKPPCYRDNDKPCGRMLSGWRDELNIEKLPGNNPKGALWREKSGRVIHKPTLESSTSAAISGRDKECITCTENKCKNDSAFKKTARIHQLKYRQQVLNASCGETCSDLSLEAAQKGMNLYSDYNVFGKAKSKA